MEKTAITWDSRASHCHRIVDTLYFVAWDKSPTSLVLIISCSHLRLHSFYSEEEIQNVAYPHNGYADSSHRHIFHTDKSDDHNYGHHADDLAFGSKRHGSFPVSYTHLDVYKRQVLGCLGQLRSEYSI